MTATTNLDEGPDGRRAARSSMYVAAMLCCRGESAPVRIRNMSPTGALVEGDFELAEDEIVNLVRGGLSTEAYVVWCSSGRSGLNFTRPVEVKRWLAPPTNAEQHRVDALVRLVQAGAVPLPVPELDPPLVTGPALERGVQFADDLHAVRAMLARLSDTLAGHPRVIVEHGGALQSLDIAMQMLAAIASELCDGEGAEDAATKLSSLRRSMAAALAPSG